MKKLLSERMDIAKTNRSFRQIHSVKKQSTKLEEICIQLDLANDSLKQDVATRVIEKSDAAEVFNYLYRSAHLLTQGALTQLYVTEDNLLDVRATKLNKRKRPIDFPGVENVIQQIKEGLHSGESKKSFIEILTGIRKSESQIGR